MKRPHFLYAQVRVRCEDMKRITEIMKALGDMRDKYGVSIDMHLDSEGKNWDDPAPSKKR